MAGSKRGMIFHGKTKTAPFVRRERFFSDDHASLHMCFASK